MKFFKKNNTFRTIKLNTLLNIIAFLSLALSAFFCLTHFSHNIFTSHFTTMVIHTGIKAPYSVPKINIAETMLSLSLPGASFSYKEEVLPTESEPSTEAVLPILPPQNNAESIIYNEADEKGYKSVEGIYILNQTNKQIDIEKLLNKKLDLEASSLPSVLIIHTHTTESYTPSEKYNYTPTETDRTTDSQFNMISVGKVIYDYLTQNSINAIHDTTVNDYPSYSTSYSNSLKRVKHYTEKYPSIKIVIDVHRDAIESKNGTKLRPVTTFSPQASQVMLVVGTNDSGLNHPDWQSNLSFAIKLQHKMNSLYPSLARPINLRRERFNQHLAPFAFILEVGTNGNTLDEAKEGARLFSEALVTLLKN